jgi:tetratricopeptide (TPR) repeat protein
LGISYRLVIFGLALWFCGLHSLRGADVSQLRKQVAVAEEADDKPAIIELNRRIVAIVPSDSNAWKNIVQGQFEIEDYDRVGETLEAWQKAVKRPPAAIEDFRGDLAVKLKDYANAERHWLAFLARKPSPGDAAAIYDKLADLCTDQSRWADCASYDAKAIAAEDSASRRVAHACVLLRLRQWDAAYAEIAKANKIDSTDAEVKKWLPQFERLEEFLPQIRTLDAQIEKSANDSALLLDRARVFTLAERPPLALDDCEQAIKLRPASMRARIQTAEALFDVGQPDDAAKLQVSSKLARDKDNHVSDQALRELSNEDTQIAQDPGKAEPLAARAKTLRDLRQLPLALADARAALAIDDKLAAAHFEAAHDLDALDQSKEALIHAVKATELNPKDGAAWYYRGVLEAERADFPAAIESLTRSLKLGETLEALRKRENCQRRIGRVDNANADLKRIRELE